MSIIFKSYHSNNIIQDEKHEADKNDLISTGEAANILRVSRNTIRRWAQEGILSGHRINNNRGHYRFSRDYILQKAAAHFPNDYQDNNSKNNE